MKKIIKQAFIAIVIFLVLFFAGSCLVLYELTGFDTVSLEDIDDTEKQTLISMMELEEYSDDISFEKIETPKVYKDIYYVIYFNTENDALIARDHTITEEGLLLERISSNDNKYCCDVSSVTGKSIDILEKIISKYN